MYAFSVFFTVITQDMCENSLNAGANLLIMWYVMVMAIDCECDIELEQ